MSIFDKIKYYKALKVGSNVTIMGGSILARNRI